MATGRRSWSRGTAGEVTAESFRVAELEEEPPPAMITKYIVVVDEHVNVHDEQDVLFHLFSNCDPARDTEIVRGPVDILDHASPVLGVGSKMGFDATVKLLAEGQVRQWPKELEMDAATKELVTRRWNEYGF